MPDGYVMRFVALADGRGLPDVDPGDYLASWDIEAGAPAGAGMKGATWTSDPAKAHRFATWAEAATTWRSTSRTIPLRPDGKPNRPLTSFTVEIVELD